MPPADRVDNEVRRALLEDGSLAIRAEAGMWEAVAPWVPRVPERAAVAGEVCAWIVVEAGAPAFAPPAKAPAFELRGVDGWLHPSGTVLLRDAPGRVSAVIDLAEWTGTVRLRVEDGTEVPSLEIFAALTLVSALLLGRIGRTLVHAGAIAAPDGRAWMLAGGSFSGKSTSCITLIRGGWSYLADDHVVLGRNAAGEVRVEGWPRRFNLDEGYGSGASSGVRTRVDPGHFAPGGWVRSAPLGGLLFPRVEADLPTGLAPIHPGDALARLLGQSPWLLADPGAAATVLALLQRSAETAAYDLRLGGDCYGNFTRLQNVLAAALNSPPSLLPGRLAARE